MAVALACFGAHLACGVGMFATVEPVACIVIGCLAAIVAAAGIIWVRAPFAKILYGLTLPFAIHLVVVYDRALEGALTDFYGLYFFYDVLPLIFFSALATVAAYVTPTSFESPYT